mgnify:CR=1 FL=1
MKSIILSNGETLFYRERPGGNQPLVLVHGNMTSSVHWDVLLDKLPGELKVYAVDMRGFGQSTYHQPINSIHDFAQDIKEWATTLGLSSFILMGWSLGGAVSMDYAAHYPEDVEKLILMCSASTRGYPIFKKDEHGLPIIEQPLHSREEIARDPIQVLPMLNAYREKNKEVLKAIWNVLIYTSKKPNDEQYDKYLEDMLTQRNLVDVDYALANFNISNHPAPTGEGTGLVKNLTMPTLVLTGKNDLVVSRTMTEELFADLPHKITHIELNAGHSPLIDDLENLNQAIKTFILG